MTRKMRDYSLVDWYKYFHLTPETSSGLTWKENLGRNGFKGNTAGTKCYDCYSKEPSSWQVRLHGSLWLIHRVILVMMNIDILDKVVDHIDGNPFNNKLDNLRVTTQEMNTRNRKIHTNNASGVTGISRHTNGTGRDYYGAMWSVNGIRKTKYFSIQDFGHDVAFQMACDYRKQMLKNLNKDGYGYSERHGEDRTV